MGSVPVNHVGYANPNGMHLCSSYLCRWAQCPVFLMLLELFVLAGEGGLVSLHSRGSLCCMWFPSLFYQIGACIQSYADQVVGGLHKEYNLT